MPECHRFQLAAATAWIDGAQLGRGDVAWATAVPGGPPLVLEGSAYVCWIALAEGGSLNAITARVARLAGVSVDEVRTDVARFLDEMVSRGLVVESSSADVNDRSAIGAPISTAFSER